MGIGVAMHHGVLCAHCMMKQGGWVGKAHHRSRLADSENVTSVRGWILNAGIRPVDKDNRLECAHDVVQR